MAHAKSNCQERNLFHHAATLNNGVIEFLQGQQGGHLDLASTLDSLKQATQAVRAFTSKSIDNDQTVEILLTDPCYSLLGGRRQANDSRLKAVQSNHVTASLAELLHLPNSPARYSAMPFVSAAVVSAVILFNIGVIFQLSASRQQAAAVQKQEAPPAAVSDSQARLLNKAQAIYRKAHGIVDSLEGSFDFLRPSGRAACDFVAIASLNNLSQNAHLLADFQASRVSSGALSNRVQRVKNNCASSPGYYAEHLEEILALADSIKCRTTLVTNLLLPLSAAPPAA